MSSRRIAKAAGYRAPQLENAPYNVLYIRSLNISWKQMDATGVTVLSKMGTAIAMRPLSAYSLRFRA